VKFGIYQVSRRGGREKNEDRMGYCYTREAGLFALADGMGGHPEGEVAAQIALQTLAAMFQRDAKPTLAEPASFLEAGVLVAHQSLLHYGAEKGLSDTPRTTVVACVLQGGLVYWAHCGDSRLYLVRGGSLIARTRDHSYSELQEALGRPPAGAERFNRNVLFTCLGSPGRPMVDLSGPLALEPGDRLLLCSDGLWGNVSDELITDMVGRAEIGVAVPELVELALRNGGPRCDNVTALAMEWEAAEEEGETALVDHPLDAAVSSSSATDAGFATTIRPHLGPSDTRAADDIDIDRSIREINDAIRRGSAPPKP
jgi:PPM family protein phosphatase